MLHLINFSFAGPLEAKRCLARLDADDRLLFLGNGVFSPIKRSVSAAEIQSSLDRIRVFALLPDLEIRLPPISVRFNPGLDEAPRRNQRAVRPSTAG